MVPKGLCHLLMSLRFLKLVSEPLQRIQFYLRARNLEHRVIIFRENECIVFFKKKIQDLESGKKNKNYSASTWAVFWI